MSILLWPDGAPLAKGSEPADRPTITPYLLEKSGRPAPCMLICPGGGYQSVSASEGEPIAAWLNGLGIAAVVLKYRVAPYRHPCPLMDVTRAMRHIRHHAAEWNIDPERIGVIGFSSGGHVASTIGTHYDLGNPEAEDPIERHSSRPDLMVLCYPRITMIHYPHPYHANLLGEDPTEELKAYLSNERHVTEETPPVFMWITGDDRNVHTGHLLLFASALTEHKVPYEMYVFESGGHGLGLARSHPTVGHWPELCGIWMKKHGF